MPTLEEVRRQLEELNELKAILAGRADEVERMLCQNALALFEPTRPEACKFGDSQYEFLISVAKERVAFGANRSGKTVICIVDHAFHASGRYPDYYPEEGKIAPGRTVDRKGLCSRIYAADYEHGIEEVILPLLRKYIPADLWTEPYRDQSSGRAMGVVLTNGWEITFMSSKQSVLQSTGFAADLVQWDEPPQSEDMYFESIRGTIDKGGRIIVGATPTKLKDDWFSEGLKDMDLTGLRGKYKPLVVSLDVRDNPHIPKDDVEWWAARLPAHMRAMRLEGKSASEELRVYGGFIRTEEIWLPSDYTLPTDDKGHPKDWLLSMGVDPHDGKPPAMLWIAWMNPALNGGESEGWAVMESFNPKVRTIDDAVLEIIRIETMLGQRASIRVMDPNYGKRRSAINGLNIHTEYQEAAKRHGVQMGFRVQFTDSQEFGHEQVRKLLAANLPNGRPKLRIAPDLRFLATSLARYRYKDESKSKVLDNDYKHMPDLLRYLAINPNPWALYRSYLSDEEKLRQMLVEPEDDPPVITLRLLKQEFVARGNKW